MKCERCEDGQIPHDGMTYITCPDCKGTDKQPEEKICPCCGERRSEHGKELCKKCSEKSTSDEIRKKTTSCKDKPTCGLRQIDPSVSGCWDKKCDGNIVNNKNLEELSMELYVSSDLCEDIDHNVFTQIYGSGYKSAQQKAQAEIEELKAIIFLQKAQIDGKDSHIKELEQQIKDMEYEKDFH
jgi:hypothetical protein